MQKKVSMAITAAKRHEVAAHRYVVLAVANVATLFGGVGSLVFKVKKLPNGLKDLKTVKSEDPKPKKQTVANEKRVAAISRIPLKATAQCWRLPSLFHQEMFPCIYVTYPD
jgi:hypothetical protein